MIAIEAIKIKDGNILCDSNKRSGNVHDDSKSENCDMPGDNKCGDSYCWDGDILCDSISKDCDTLRENDCRNDDILRDRSDGGVTEISCNRDGNFRSGR